MDHRPKRTAADAQPRSQVGKISRRALVAGTVATTALAAVLPLSNAVCAQVIDPKQDMMAFLLLSAALTGVHVGTLAPEFRPDKDILHSDPGVDPINIKDVYFGHVKACHAAVFGKLLDIARQHSSSAAGIIIAVEAGEDTKYLARSLVLLWYLGSWYEPGDLKNNSAPPGSRKFVPSRVASAKAYTQGLVWRIAQAHPMGYSNLQFGYWSRVPADPNDTSALITTAIP